MSISENNGWVDDNGTKRRVNAIEKYSYLIGQKINKWSVIDICNDRRHPDAICVCECGTTKRVGVRNLINDASKDCGCGRKKMLRDTRTKNLIGKKFGMLTVVEMLEESDKFKRRMYRCVCECGNETIVPSVSLVTEHTLSCGCINSYYNMYIDKYLSEIGIKHMKEYSVKIDGSNYRFDFYLPDYNLFIEYDGQQHFMPVRFSGSNEEKNYEAFKKTQYRDGVKNQYCSDNNIELLRIPYWECKNIETIIDNCLQRLNERGVKESA